MIKRILATVVLALSGLSASYAEIQLKDLGGGRVSVTFLSQDSSSEMGVIGSFNNWTVPGEAMTKNSDGVWEKTIEAQATDEIVYKFYSKGTWIFDELAPEKKDDGFGGFNGLIVVADILSGATPVSPAPVASLANASPPGDKVFTSKLNFGTFTIIGSKTTFSTQGVVDKTQKGLETDTTGLFAKSFWKIGGTIVPHVTLWFEVKAFEGYQAVWAQDSRGKVSPGLSEGFSALVGGLVTNPVFFLGGGSNPALNSLKTGLETPYVVWETGYGYAKPQKRTALLWETLAEKDGNNGYMRFDLGPDLRKAGDLTIEANVTPNVMSGNYGLFSWLGLSLRGTKLDFQYDAKSAESTLLPKVFNKLYHQDFLFGGRTRVADVELTGQVLVNQFSETAFEAGNNIAAEAKASWALPNDLLGVTAGYRYTGALAELLYGNNSDALGDKGTQRIQANLYGKPVDSLKGGIDTSLSLDNVTPTGSQKSYYTLYGKPWAEISLEKLAGKKSSLNTYAKLNYALRDGYVYEASKTAFNLSEAGAKYFLADPLPGTVSGMDVYYGLNSGEKDKMLHTAIANLTMPKDLTAQMGLGLRTVRDYASETLKKANNTAAFTLGGSLKIAEPAIKTPLFYAAFVYNMDPYDDGSNNLKMSDFITDGGVGKNDGKAILRVMMKWDF